MKNIYLRTLSLFFGLSLICTCAIAEKVTLNVKQFGAVPNDGKDDTKAFQDCIDAAMKKGKLVEIFVPFGVYNVSKELNFDFLEADITFSGEIKNGKTPTLLSTSTTNIIWAKGFLFNPSKGSFTVRNLTLVGDNKPYTASHPKVNKDAWNAVILITDKSRAVLNNLTIENFYGQGIHITTTQIEGIDSNSRFSSVNITDCKITDVWGFNPKKDDYGDAIYLAAVASGTLRNNQIVNRTSKTKQLGRCGIVLEYLCENIQVLNNNVEGGYDRPIHIEGTLGGHKIMGNSFKGSDLGLIVAENKPTNYKKVTVKNNLFTNQNLAKGHSLKKSYAASSFGDRALILIFTEGNFASDIFSFTGNRLIVDNASEYNSNSLINNRSKSARFEKNRFESMDKSKNISIFNYGKGKFLNNQMVGELNMH